MRQFRQRPDAELTNGPAKLAQALAIDKMLNGASLLDDAEAVWLEEGVAVGPEKIITGPRIGLGKTPEPWYSIPWRFWINDNPFVSR